MGHYPLFTAGSTAEWYAQEGLKEIIPRYVALDDAMVYVVCKLFTAKERGQFFGVDFDLAGHIYPRSAGRRRYSVKDSLPQPGILPGLQKISHSGW